MLTLQSQKLANHGIKLHKLHVTCRCAMFSAAFFFYLKELFVVDVV